MSAGWWDYEAAAQALRRRHHGGAGVRGFPPRPARVQRQGDRDDREPDEEHAPRHSADLPPPGFARRLGAARKDDALHGAGRRLQGRRIGLPPGILRGGTALWSLPRGRCAHEEGRRLREYPHFHRGLVDDEDSHAPVRERCPWPALRLLAARDRYCWDRVHRLRAEKSDSEKGSGAALRRSGAHAMMEKAAIFGGLFSA